MSGKRIWAAAATIALLGATTAATAAWRSVAPYGKVGAVYVSKQLCSCVFVTGRSDGGCRREFEPDIQSFKVNIDHHPQGADGEVRASLGPFAGRAGFEKPYGCKVAD